MALQQIPAATVSTGDTWTPRITGLTYEIYTIAYNGTDLYVAAGDSESLYTSPDGITWTSRTSNFGGGQAIFRVAYGNGLWVAVGGGGKMVTSSDGITWTARTANMSTNTIFDVVYANSLWVAVGGGGGATNTGGITYSSDGITWTRKSQTITMGTNYFTVVYNGTNWVIGGNTSTNNYLYATTPSGTWTAANVSSGSIIKLMWDGTRHIWYQNAFHYSTSTSTLAGGVQYNSLGTLSGGDRQIYYYNNKVYFGYQHYQSFTPTSTGTVTLSKLEFSPTIVQSASNSPALNVGYMDTIFAGPAGLIIAGNLIIFTSF